MEMTTKEIKEELKRRGLLKKGRKEELRRRLDSAKLEENANDALSTTSYESITSSSMISYVASEIAKRAELKVKMTLLEEKQKLQIEVRITNETSKIRVRRTNRGLRSSRTGVSLSKRSCN